jgi:hypothetical protein
MKVTTSIFAACCLVTVLTALPGCGNSGGPDPKVESQRAENLGNMREYFTKANGNYDSLSAEDKAAFVKLCGGDQAKALTTWNAMKYGPSGPPKGGQ